MRNKIVKTYFDYYNYLYIDLYKKTDRKRFKIHKQVLEIAKSKLTTIELSEKYKVKYAVIYQIRNGKSWGKITGIEYDKRNENKGIRT